MQLSEINVYDRLCMQSNEAQCSAEANPASVYGDGLI